ncbi:MotA/TolQ/ExbB proton channel family protein [Methylovulum miyakonense]|uniref:MotA/TolQ/ExbB proton channel family protein n=1 Tax=Methylovulum miyakonense TaxID=645578 RepID=UPI000372550F|nr:MotA/TolQ/ExbB proton channel family protein [Methylovulum miyakonense]
MSETGIVNGTLCLLGCFSLLTWSVILLKAGEAVWNAFRNHRFIKQFGDNSKPIDLQPSSQATRVYQAGLNTLKRLPKNQLLPVGQYQAWHELLERTMRQQLQKEKAKMESGLGWLASFGSTSPFVGLFGTVWGIMHALKDIGTKGSASLDVVAGPIGEALIATGLGIAVAIPAVLAYNFFLRQNRATLASLEHFASDFLHDTMQHHLLQHTENENVHAHI